MEKEARKNGPTEGEKQVRKERQFKGRTQKHVAWRCDFELIPFLNSKANKGNFINGLIRAAAQREGWPLDAEDIGPERGDEE